MFMIDMHLDSVKLLRFAHTQGHPLNMDEDFGYATHAWLAAALGDLAPQPYRLFERQNGLHLLGYTNFSVNEICNHACTFAEPLATEVCHWTSVAGKPMPDSWTKGSRLGFEVRTCPVVRRIRERDVFLSALERAIENGAKPPYREEVYKKWLARRLKAATAPGGDFVDLNGEKYAPIVEILPRQIAIIGFRRIKVLRRGKRRGPKINRGIERPDVIFSGELVIRNPKEFSMLLKRGVGRHRAFGFGMMLLRPPAGRAM